jgi:hypothetical protein
MSSSSPPHDEPPRPPAAAGRATSDRAVGTSNGSATAVPGESVPASATAADDPPRRRDSQIPMPDGFKQRRSSRPPPSSGATRPASRAADLTWPPSRRASEPPAVRGSAPGRVRVLYERAHEPSDDSPILYRERAYAVDEDFSDAELEAHLEAELDMIRVSWRERDAPQFVQLASFDHDFETEPRSPPIATLSFKDWHGASEVWVRGVRRVSAPPAELEGPPAAPERANAADSSAELDDAGPDRSGPESGPSWAAPSHSGQFRVPDEADDAGEESLPPPSSQRVLAGEELLGALFERMHELMYLPDIAAGADYLITILEEHIPCDGVLIHVFDIAASEFVVVRALGPNAAEVALIRTSGTDSHLAEAARRATTIELTAADAMSSPVLWEALGLDIASALCSPAHQNQRYLGAVEIGREIASGPFSAAEIHALEYVCEQFADFIANRPLELDAESLRPR